MAETEVDLSTVTTDELWEELKSRHDSSVFAYSADGEKSGSSHNGLWWYGSQAEALGLLEWGNMRMRRMIQESYHEDSDA